MKTNKNKQSEERRRKKRKGDNIEKGGQVVKEAVMFSPSPI